jgi:hypothetical protein
MAGVGSRLTTIFEEEIEEMKENTIPQNTKRATKFVLKFSKVSTPRKSCKTT